MTEFKTIETKPETTIEVDRWNRYVLPHPETGEKMSWTRATTVAGTLADRFGLEQWDQRNVVWGLGQRPDLFARAAAAKADDKATLAEVVKEAKTAAASKSGALLGSAIHQFTERIDAGEPIEIVPEMWREDVVAYRDNLAAAGIAVTPGWIEVLVCVPELEIAGKLDRLVNGMWPLPRVGDVKTGANAIRYGMVEIPVQLGIYAHARYRWTGEGWEEMPKVDLERAVVMHMPPGQGICDLYEIDIAAGWEAVQLAVDVREWRKRKGLYEIIPAVGGSPASPATDEGEGADSTAAAGESPSPSTTDELASRRERSAAVRARVEAIKAHSDKARQWLAARWPVGIPTFPKGGPRSTAELRDIAEICERTEQQFEISDPNAAHWPEGDDPGPAEEEEGVKPSDDMTAGKGGEAGPPSAEDPPAPSSPSANGDEGLSWRPSMHSRWDWCRERVDAIKASGVAERDGFTPRKRLAGLWSQRDEIPTFPKGGPRTDDELSAVVGMCDLVEMEFELPFGPSDPTAPKQTKATREAARS